ncbi:MAG: hypothetical protein ACK5QT_02580 [Oligoflexia bacterium]
MQYAVKSPFKTAKPSQASRRFVAFLVTVLLSACTNTSVRSALNSLNSVGTGQTSGSGSQSSNGTSTTFRLVRVLRSQSDPGGKFDFIGEGNGTFLNFCNPQELPLDQTDLCQCVYSYIDSSGNSFTVGERPTLVESDLVRCPYTNLPPDVSTLQARLYYTIGDLYSNTVVFSFGADAPATSLTDISNYVTPFRFQCKNNVYISHPGETNSAGGGSTITAVYDPIQSERDSLAFGFNFYTSNPGKAVALYASQPAANQKLWECPLDLTSASKLGLDLTLYSRRSDGQSSQIFPPVGSVFDRSSFVLAKKKIGVFNVPINAPLMPGVPNGIQDANGTVEDGIAPALGFGVLPTPAAGGENCPSSNVAIPAGYHWAKLWLFRASLPARFAVTSERVRNTVISCSPGTWETDTQVMSVPSLQADPPPYFPDCGNRISASYRGCNLNSCSTLQDANGSSVVDRILLLPAAGNDPNAARCVKLGEPGDLNASLAAGKTTDPSGLFLNPAYLGISTAQGIEIPLGTDVWTSRDTTNGNACGGANPIDSLNLCTTPSPSSTNLEAAGASNFPHETGSAARPLPRIPIDQSSDGSGFSSRFDYVFVVTPTFVSKQQMEAASSDQSDNHPELAYVPFRFTSASACQSADPLNPPPGDCKVTDRLSYKLKSTDISVNADDPNNGGSNRNLTFPVCVLQPD